MMVMGRVENSIVQSLRLCFRLGFGKADRAFTLLPLTPLLEQLDALKALENGTLATGSSGYFE